ncbi:ATG27 [Candida theae]|uniref:Autophagy-related protein 27 n=1 Tax=Candida theae TaxID=1198502 RepID=A0AAD5FWL1_9ASCO|nr:ATG27 [Candida theae]KAI5949525.1 ATG27 [Candida theae]
MLKSVISLLVTSVMVSNAIDCSVKELQPYNLESIKGTHSFSTIKTTPPTKTNITWTLGICEVISSDKKSDLQKCPQNSDICGITSILRDNEDPIISEIIGFNSNLQKSFDPLGDEGAGGIKIRYSGVNWGDSLIDAEVSFVCDESVKESHKFELDGWNGEVLKVSMKSKAACITSDSDKKKNNDKNKNSDKKKGDNGESWGWFTWIFIFLVLFLSIYIIGGAWFQYNKGNAIDFQSALKEVLENFFTLLQGLPNFIREILEKVVGRSNSRGDYSAV